MLLNKFAKRKYFLYKFAQMTPFLSSLTLENQFLKEKNAFGK